MTATTIGSGDFQVSAFFVADDGKEHPWRDPWTVPASEFEGYRAAARSIIEGMLDGGRPDGAHPIGLRIIDPAGKVIFTYVRPHP